MSEQPSSVPPHLQSQSTNLRQRSIESTISSSAGDDDSSSQVSEDGAHGDKSLTGDNGVDGPDLEKAETARSAKSATGSAAGRRVSRIQSIGRRAPHGYFTHPLASVKTGEDVIVDFDGMADPYRPINWPVRKKIITTMLYGFTTFGATFSSSVYSPALEQIAEEFHVSREVTTLGISLLIAGFGLGPLLWAPLSEVYGRKPAVLIPYFLAGIFSFATATAKDLQTIMITRFFAGVFGSAPITNTGGVLADIWSTQQRGTALVLYASAVVGGPTLGPIVGGAICQSYLRWRWTEYITGIFMMFMLTLDVLILDESYPNALLVAKAQRLRHETGNWALHAKHEEWDVSIKQMSQKFLVRPFQLLGTPICFLMAAYASFVYGILYLFLGAFPIVFEEERGWNQVVGALPFLALLLGIVLAGCLNIFNNRFYVRAFEANGNRAVPEARLPPMMFGSVFFSAGLFVFGWTGAKNIHWIAPCIGAVLMGLGFFTIFQSALNYLIDTFQRYSASAVGANTFLRSCTAAAFPLFTEASMS
ncbi:putative MFS multidrug transporter [Xylona heveae TC161]|uniref:Putative MFS multidrug transporter n=1 Tax=Xylona heveae (strain CBS 132557 / TC161) TaxID=1328760 RepID=A0A165IZD7_XYLHT|nr:putative MFS multidrug transporter [Xylona heveae TC161]KZF25582.1 putative MFS multidrug transporter [Xylona heveae TC161]